MKVLISTVAGTFAVDLETDEVEPWDAGLDVPPAPVLNLPRVVAAAAAGATVAAVVATKPPLLISYDAGSTWRESGRGLPAGRAVAISDEDPGPDRLRGAQPALPLSKRRRLLELARGGAARDRRRRIRGKLRSRESVVPT